MKLEQFFHNKQFQQQISKASVICLRAKNYPLLFCREFITYLAKHNKWNIDVQDMQGDSAAAMASLHTTFLGHKSWYWLHSDAGIAKKILEQWHTFLRAYTGPNTIIFCTASNKVASSWYVIDLPEVVNSSGFKQIAWMMGVKQYNFIEHLFQKVGTVSLDQAIILCRYATLIGKSSRVFFDSWLPQLVVADVSFFGLSQALFARNARQFLKQWQRVRMLYAPQFWISFWSEQLWRAYCYIRLYKEGKKLEAKKIGFRLPFSFLQNDWRNYSLQELQNAHNQLYSIDYSIKQGASESGLELFYINFFNPSFN